MSVSKLRSGPVAGGAVRRLHGWLFVAALATPLAACSGDPSTEQTEGAAESDPAATLAVVLADSELDTRLNLITRIHASPTHVVEFYEPSPGQILVSEAATASEESIVSQEDTKLSADELYRKLAGTDAPAALLEAVGRAAPVITDEDLRSSLPAAIGESAGGTVEVPRTQPTDQSVTGQRRQAVSPPMCSAAWFTQQGHCPNRNQFEWCLLDWWNGAFAQTGATDNAWGAVCAETGQVALTVTGVGVWSVPQGTWRWASKLAGRTCIPIPAGWHCYWNDFPIRYDVTEAIGKRFQFGGYFEQLPSCTSLPFTGCL